MSQYSNGCLERSALEVLNTAVPVIVPHKAREKGISERARLKNGWFAMLSCIAAILSRIWQSQSHNFLSLSMLNH